MNKSVRRSGRYALLTCAVFTWLSLPVCAADSPQGGDNRVETGDIVVKVNAAREEAKYESQSTTVITREDIAKKQAKSVEDIIFDETGVSRTVDAMGRVTVSIRGAEPRHTLILVDGRPVMGDFAKYSGQGDELQRLGTENVERIEIIRGAASAKYGADAIGGVINVITRQPARKAGMQINVEGRRAKQDGDFFPYANFFLRADSGQQGKLRMAAYGGKREIMPVYSMTRYPAEMDEHGNPVPGTGYLRSNLRYYGSIKNIGAVFNWDLNDNNSLEFTGDKIKEDMKMFQKRSSQAMNMNARRNVDRNTYGVTYKGHDRKTDWKFGYNYSKMREDDITTMQVFENSPYQGSDALYYLDDLKHTMKSFNASANTQANGKHLLTYGFGYSKETGEGSRIKNADSTYYRYINPWDYDKNLALHDGTVASSIHDYTLVKNEAGIPRYDEELEWYGFTDSGGHAVKPAYTYEMYDRYGFQPEATGAPDDIVEKAHRFANELIEQNPDLAAMFGGSVYTGPMLLQFYYNASELKKEGKLNLAPRWHPANSAEAGKYFKEDSILRNNRQTVGRAEIRKYNFYIGDTWQVNKDTILSPIFRMDHSSLFGNYSTFNMGLTHNIKGKANHRFKANIGTGYTEPGMGELYYNWEMYAGSPAGTVDGIGSELGRLGYYWVGNRDLRPEKSLNFDIGLEAENGKTSTRFNIFHNRIRDYMTTYFTGYTMDFNPTRDVNGKDIGSLFKWLTPPDMIYSFKNIGKAEITGFEAQVDHRFNKHWSAKLGYTYLHAINKSDPDMPRQLLNKPTHKVDIGVTYENKGWTASLWGDYYIRMLDANSIANNGNYMESSETGTHYFFADSDKIEYQKKTFGLWNLLVQKKIDKDSTVYAGISNILNHRDDDQAFMERTYRFGVNIKFGPTILTPEEKAAKKAARAVKTANGESVTEVDADKQDTLERDWFIRPVFDVNKKKGVELIGDYRMRWNSFTGKNNKPDQATMTMTTSVGSAYKNYREKGGHGFEQRLRLGVDARIGDNTNIKVLGSAAGYSGVDTRHDVADSKGLNRQRLDTADMTRHVKKWDFSLGRLTEPMGVTGYWFGKEYDGARAVWTSGKNQVRLGYGDFRRSTGISDSAYTHVVRKRFYRAPTPIELLGSGGIASGHNTWATAYDKENGVAGFNDGKGLYQILGAAGSWEEQKEILQTYLDGIKQADPDGYAQYIEPVLNAPERLLMNNYAWHKIEVYETDDSGHIVGSTPVKTYLAMAGDPIDENHYIDPSRTDPLSYSDMLDKEKLEAAAEATWNRSIGAVESTNVVYENIPYANYLPETGLVKGKKYTYKVTFDGYGEYTGDSILKGTVQRPQTTSSIRHYYVMDYSEKTNGAFTVFDKDTAHQKAVRSLWNKDASLRHYMIEYNHFGFHGYKTQGNVSESMMHIFNAIYTWALKQESDVPISKLFGSGLVGVTVGNVLVQDQVPSVKRAAFLQAKHRFGRHLGVQAWYLRSTGDDTHSLQYADLNAAEGNSTYSYDRLASVFGLGFKWRLGSNVSFSYDWGQNRTDFGRMLNGSSVSKYVEGSSSASPDRYDYYGREQGGTPRFWVARLDFGRSDMDVPGSWNAFVDYKYFQHGSFFGGNGTEALPDRYLDGIRSFTVGAGYVPRKDFLIEAFYTFGAKGIHKRDTLYGSENFELGDYTRLQATYKF